VKWRRESGLAIVYGKAASYVIIQAASHISIAFREEAMSMIILRCSFSQNIFLIPHRPSTQMNSFSFCLHRNQTSPGQFSTLLMLQLQLHSPPIMVRPSFRNWHQAVLPVFCWRKKSYTRDWHTVAALMTFGDPNFPFLEAQALIVVGWRVPRRPCSPLRLPIIVSIPFFPM